MKISDVRVRIVKTDKSKIKASASITIDDCFVVHDIKVIEGNEGYFIATTEAQRIVALENEPDAYEFTLSSIAIGDFVIIGLPGEPFSEIGTRIINESDFPHQSIFWWVYGSNFDLSVS